MDRDALKGRPGAELAKKTVDAMAGQSISPTPQNYEVWLNHVGGWVPEMSVALNNMVTAGIVSDEKSESLHEQFFSNPRLSMKVMETGTKIAQELAEALSTLREAGVSTRRYGKTLDEAEQILADQELNPDQIKDVLSTLAAATRDISNKNQALSDQLENSTREVNELRNTLHKARSEALTDSLTGVANRKQFDETLQFRIAESVSLNYPLSLLLVDIDKFKAFNDTWGHQAGDQVIRFVAATMQRLALPDHLVARYGGEEFAVIMPRATAAEARKFGERMRLTIEAKRLMRKSTNEFLGTVTISGGIAELLPDETGPQLIERSDSNLYASKHNGRNQVTVTENAARPAGRNAA
jgi:diguanylate cyclase